MRRFWLYGLIVGGLAAGCTSKTPTAPTPPPAATCTFTLSSTSLNVAGVGGTATLAVTTGNTCAWTVSSNAGFVSVTSASNQTGSGTINITVSQNAGDARTAILTAGGQTVTVNQAAGDALFGNFAGTISKGANCPASLPASVPWTGLIRRTSAGSPELVISLPTLGINNQTVNLTLATNTLQFAVFVDSVYTFNATIAADRRSLNGTFSGGSCSGTWNGARQ